MYSEKKLAAIVLLWMTLLFLLPVSVGNAFQALPMDTLMGGASPPDAGYLSATQYQDSFISVEIFSGYFADTDYTYAHIKIADASQLRTAPASVVNSQSANFRSTSTARGRLVAKAVNAVIAINGDYYTKSNKCQVVMRMTQQIRNIAKGNMDLLIIDKNGDFSAIKKCTKAMYKDYYERNEQNMYQVFCFGPVLVEDGVSVVGENYYNGEVGAQNKTQRTAIAQLDKLEYLLVTTAGPQSKGSKGMSIPELAQLVEVLGKQFSLEGCKMAFNLDGGNSTTMVFKHESDKGKGLVYTKVNSPEIERFLSDIIYFATLETND